MKKRVWICLALCALLAWTAIPALAENCFTIDVDTLDMDSLNSCLLYTSDAADE